MEHEIILVRGLGMAGTLYGVPSDVIVNGMFTRNDNLAGTKVTLTFKDTGETKLKGSKHRRVFYLYKIQPREG